jgi:hypothetical protein
VSPAEIDAAVLDALIKLNAECGNSYSYGWMIRDMVLAGRTEIIEFGAITEALIRLRDAGLVTDRNASDPMETWRILTWRLLTPLEQIARAAK